jgi:xanthine dehydrogenase accessory factor
MARRGLPGIELDRRTAFIALTHDPKIDDPALTAALEAPASMSARWGPRRPMPDASSG